MTVLQIAEMRAASQLPIDLYVESPDSLGGVVRGNEIGDLVAAGAPLYAKFGLRNSRALLPGRCAPRRRRVRDRPEKVHRAAVALEWQRRLHPELVQSKPGAAGLGVPQSWQ